MANLDHLIEQLAERVDTILEERDELWQEVVRLSACLVEFDETCVRQNREPCILQERAREEGLLQAREQASIESKIQGLSDRLIALVKTQRL